MHTNFGGSGLSGFGDKISLWSIIVETFNWSESAQKIHVSRVDVKCIHTNFGGCGYSSFGDIATFKNGKISLSSWKGNLAVFEGSNISETGIAMPTKIGVHAFDINPYLHKFFEANTIN